MIARHNHPPASERTSLAPFDPLRETLTPRDQRDLMERPFFALAKTKRLTPIQYRAGNIEVRVAGLPEHGIATIWDADILIWAATQLVAAGDRGLPTSRFFRFTPRHLLTAIGRAAGNREYILLKAALARLQSTVIRTSIRQGPHWRRQQFSWINEWEELTTRSGRVEGMEFVLPDWFYQGVLDRRLVLTIDPAYFRLTGGIERWLYRVVRKHAGRQRHGWIFDLRHLHAKSASLARYSDFAIDIRAIVARQPLPGYALVLLRDAQGRECIQMQPRMSQPVENHGATTFRYGTSGAKAHGTSGADPTGLQAHAPASVASQKHSSDQTVSAATSQQSWRPNFSNRFSNSSSVGQLRAVDDPQRDLFGDEDRPASDPQERLR